MLGMRKIARKIHNILFGKVLRQLRQAKHLTQDELAHQAHLDRTYISLLELGQRSPTLDTMMSLSTAVDVDFGSLSAHLSEELHKHETEEKLHP